MIIVLSLLVALVGVLMFALSTNGKLVEIGRMMFFAGLLAFLLEVHSAWPLVVTK
jgi:Na+/phosphate symporter